MSLVQLDFAKLPTRIYLILICVSALMVVGPGKARAEDLIGLCPRCSLLVGVGATYRLFGWSDGVVVPLTLESDQNRWELLRSGLARQAARAGDTPLVGFLDQATQSGPGLVALSFGF